MNKAERIAQITKREESLIREALADPGESVPFTLRAHLLIEHMLNRIIRAVFPRPGALDQIKLSYHQKLALVEACAVLDEHTVTALRELNKLRNACAHDLARRISLGDVGRIGAPYGKQYVDAKERHHRDPLVLLLANVIGWVQHDLVFAAVTSEIGREARPGGSQSGA